MLGIVPPDYFPIQRDTIVQQWYRRTFQRRTVGTALHAKHSYRANKCDESSHLFVYKVEREAMSNLYRIYPVLWNDGICTQAQTVYAIDRQPPANTFPTCCSSRPKEDPAYYWGDPTFQRLLPVSQSPMYSSVLWSCLPRWISDIGIYGYAVQGDVSSLKPFKDFYILGP